MTTTLKKSENKAPNLSKVSMVKLLKKGKKYMEDENYNAALLYYNEIWEREPEDTQVLIILSFILTKLAYRSQAIRLLERAIEKVGPKLDILQVMGDMASNMGMDETGEKIYRLQIELYPDSLAAYNNLASSLHKQERFEEAIELLQDMLEIYPENHSFWNTLGATVGSRDGESSALVFYQEAQRLNPKDYRVANNLARSLCYLDRFEEAIEMGNRAIELNPDSYDAKFLLGECYLNLGDLENGWKYYEMRLDVRKLDALVYTNKIPDWDGTDLKGKSILIMSEQGLGDELLFASAIKPICDVAKQVYIGCDPRLIPLFQRSFPKAKVCGHATANQSGHIMRSFPDFEIAHNNGELEIDYRVPICSIPKYLWKKHEDIKVKEGYLVPDAKRRAYWQEQLDKIDDNPKVGITWRSGVRSSERDRYYSDIEYWGPILNTPGLTFINMQYGDCQAELDLAKEKFGVTIHNMEGLDLKNDIDDSCAMFSCLDLALTPGNAPGIQAASVGTNVWWIARGFLFWSLGEEQPKILPNNRIISAHVETSIEDFINMVSGYIKEFAKTHNPLIKVESYHKKRGRHI